MTAFADYSYYTVEFCRGAQPKMELPTFDLYARKAPAEINRLTFGNITEPPADERVKLCCCELAELLCAFDGRSAESGGVASESVGGWSKSYEDGESQRQLLSQKTNACVRSGLAGTGLLFSGVKKC